MNTARNYVKGAIAPRQIKAIHAALHTNGLDDDEYRSMLHSRYQVKSSKQLSWQQAEELLDHLNGKAPSSHSRRGTRGVKHHSDMDGRPGYANGAQLRLIEAMFAQVTRAEGIDVEKALNSFCNRIAGVAGLRMVKAYQVEKIVKALDSMGAVKKGGSHV